MARTSIRPEALPPGVRQPTQHLMDGYRADTEGPFSGGTGRELPTERQRASFRVLDMTQRLDGGEAKTRRRRWIIGQSRGMELGLERYHMTREQLLERHVKDFIRIHVDFGKRMGEGKFQPTREEVAWMSEAAMNSGPFWDHYVPFLTALQGQATDAQYAEWGTRAAKLQIIGTYAQTELGHGSNVRGLRTTATFDASTDEWILETPTLTSMKWWPGGMAKLATHAVVYAQLQLNGTSYGVHAFMVQLRDQDHKPLPGIEIGELGPKMGDNGHDSGCMRLLGARIPRTSLLGRYQHVTRQGEYVKAAAAEASGVPTHYSSMLLTRASWVQLAGGQLAKACTIAVRYSAVRRQGFLEASESPGPAEAERKLIDYTVQRRRLLTQVAAAYALKFAARRTLRSVAILEDTSLRAEEKVELMPSLAAESGCLKALATLMAADGIEDLRRCCGGNGYLLSSGIAALALDDLWHVTAEGDYTVLLLASARFLVKRRPHQPMSDEEICMKSPDDWEDAPKVLAAINRLADLSLAAAADAVAVAKAGGSSDDDAFNAAGEKLVAAASWRGHATILAAICAEASEAEVAEGGSRAGVISALRRLAALFGCHVVARHGGVDVQVDGGEHVLPAMQRLCAQLRDDAVALVDAFDCEDRVLNSTLGVKDGRVYEALYAASQRSTRDFHEPFHGYTEHLQPLLDRDYLRKGASRVVSRL
mmetsp:Transcript_56777/g.182387  ORF Transcript_56777/g.182387 Transcript_56777/m.182387 type:complete len:706 (+) Transcript_56777:25-2142(+)